MISDSNKQPAQRIYWVLAITLASLLLATAALAQTVTVVGTRHLSGLETAPSAAQFAHTVEALFAFEPTQVCVERMSGERIEALMADPARHGFSFKPDWHGRPLATTIVPIAIELQLMLERRPADARAEASEWITRWIELSTAERIRIIALQLAGYEFHSAVLNWSWLEPATRDGVETVLAPRAVEALNEALASSHEVFSLGVPLARKAGLHMLCTADSQEDESDGIQIALELDGEAVLEDPRLKARYNELLASWEEKWQPESGVGALTKMLHFFNSDDFAEQDRHLQWETLRQLDNEAGAFHRRLMYWHARTAEISAELYRALAQGPKERVMLVIGSAHRPFSEAELRSQPWIEVMPAIELLKTK